MVIVYGSKWWNKIVEFYILKPQDATIQSLFYTWFIRDIGAGFEIPNSPQSLDIGQTQTGVFPISRFQVNFLWKKIVIPEPLMILPWNLDQ